MHGGIFRNCPEGERGQGLCLLPGDAKLLRWIHPPRIWSAVSGSRHLTTHSGGQNGRPAFWCGKTIKCLAHARSFAFPIDCRSKPKLPDKPAHRHTGTSAAPSPPKTALPPRQGPSLTYAAAQWRRRSLCVPTAVLVNKRFSRRSAATLRTKRGPHRFGLPPVSGTRIDEICLRCVLHGPF